MRSEIGSEFWDVPINDGESESIFPQNTQWYLSGRVALKAIISDILTKNECETVGLPSWCCDSMIKPFADAGIEVRFYPVQYDDGLTQEPDLSTDILLIMDYFGYTGNPVDLQGYKGIVIRDVTHSMFSASYDDADYYFGSLRKWCGVWTGGFAWTKNGHQLGIDHSDDFGYVDFRQKAMQLKERFVSGRGGDKKEYLRQFDFAENSLEGVGIAPASERDIWMARRVNASTIKKRRRSNAKMLMKAFPDWLFFYEMRDKDCPMFVPILVPEGKRNELRKYLIEKEIYCPVHWPISEYHNVDKETEKNYQNELSLVCDQRYDADDMRRMIDAITTFLS